MKKMFTCLLVCASWTLIGLCTSCGQVSQGDETNPVQAITDDVVVIEQNTPLWVRGIRGDERAYKGLNLDGHGEADDEAYICTYQFDEYEEKVTVLFIHLGTGETISKMFPVYGHYELQTGRLLDEKKDAIVLEIEVPGSNYGAVNLYVVDVTAPHEDEYGVFRDPELTLFLETRNSDILADNEVPKSFVNSLVDVGIENFVEGVSVVNVEGHELQGLSIKMDSMKNTQTTVCWDKESYSWVVCGQ